MTTVKPIVEERQHHSWGLLVQGRPATPSEGRAQQYTRIGPKDSQSLITHNNGTCLEFGPWDLVDEFDESKPFYQQVLLIDTSIKDIQSVRLRHNDMVGDEVDVFGGFRTIPYSGDGHQHVYPNGEIYNRVPSFYASVSNTASMYSTSNKSDVIGETHPGLSSDTRFGVLVPGQQQALGRGGGAHQRQDRHDRQNGRGGERVAYAQHLNRRGRRDVQFGRGQGRNGNGRGDSRVGRQFEGSNHYNYSGDVQNDYHQQQQETRHEASQHRNDLAPQHQESRNELEQHQDDAAAARRQRDNLAMSQHRDNLARRYDAISDDGVRTWGERYANAAIFNAPRAPAPAAGGVFYSAEHNRIYGEPQFQEPPIFDGFDEQNPYIPPPHLWDFTPGTQAWQDHFQMPPSVMAPSGLHTYPSQETGNNIPSFPWPYMQAPAMQSSLGDHPPYFIPGPPGFTMDGNSPYFDPGHDVGVAVPMGPNHACMVTSPRPQVVLPLATPGNHTHLSDAGESQGLLRANLHPPTPLGPSPGRSPMRTTTDEGSPLVRPRRTAPDPAKQHAPLTHSRADSGSGTDLRRLAAGHSGFAIAEAWSSPSAGAFSPGPGSPGPGCAASTTARSSPGVSNTSLGALDVPIARTTSLHELNYFGYSIPGETPAEMSRTRTPPATSGRRWFETRQYVPDGSRMSSPGLANPQRDDTFHVEHRSDDGQM
ncbi:hypothetical protein DSL72_008915 [Monilinia vaccinii-corymbosi]|uniref:Uncharacterized protein n=1 Tax=Monilinia vaccinii-corymbosi TaxID=61207 RepID=A0A8A3PSH7_9HELO|nr:hypothetical protein DSL72_008915 [Monilinia vaccinii-corymbosi]